MGTTRNSVRGTVWPLVSALLLSACPAGFSDDSPTPIGGPPWGAPPRRKPHHALLERLPPTGIPGSSAGTVDRHAALSSSPAGTMAASNRPLAVPALPPPDCVPVARRPEPDNADAVARQAVARTRAGMALARKGAFYSARREMISALQLISRALDRRTGSQIHTRALAAGLRALTEAEDFAAAEGQPPYDADLANIIATHRTPVLKDAAPGHVDPSTATRRYLTYAQQQLAFSAGQDPNASVALYGIARIHSALADQDPQRFKFAELAAVTLHQSALMVHPQNYLAANELGVLLARNGFHREAETCFQHSLAVAPRSVTWRNLATVLHHRGDAHRAEAARAQAAALSRAADPANAAGRKLRISWIEARRFAESAAPPAAVKRAEPGGNRVTLGSRR